MIWEDLQRGMLDRLRGRSANGPALDYPILPDQIIAPDDAVGTARKAAPGGVCCSRGATTTTLPSGRSAAAAAKIPGELIPSSFVTKIVFMRPF